MRDVKKILNVSFEKINIKDYLDYLNNEIIVIPPFQRRGGIWNDKKKSHFILSQMFYFTTPIIIKEINYNDKTRYHIIDGLQRTNCIISFVNDLFKLNYDFNLLSETNNSTLIKFVSESMNKKFNEIHDTYKEAFLNSELNLLIISDNNNNNYKEENNIKDIMEDMIYIFKMINVNSTPLNKTELRYAIYFSKNMEKINTYIKENKDILTKVFKIKIPHKRMKELDLILRMLGIYMFGEDIINIYKNYDNYLNIVASEIYNDEKSEIIDEFFERLIEIVKYMYNEKLNIHNLLNKNYSFYDILGISMYIGLSEKEIINFINHLKENERFINNISERDNMKHDIFKDRITLLLEEADKIKLEE